jgi:hypothetical protein
VCFQPFDEWLTEDAYLLVAYGPDDRAAVVIARPRSRLTIWERLSSRVGH